jgi:putative restriction endonuclease
VRKAYVGVTDWDWYQFLSSRTELSEVNFWRPGGGSSFRALAPGDLFLFKLHAPNNFIVGGGFFEAFSLLPMSLAWETFGPMNGVGSLAQMRRRIERYRRAAGHPSEDYTIGNIALQQVFFFRRDAWIPAPVDFHRSIVQGKTYDLNQGVGAALAAALEERLSTRQTISDQKIVAEGTAQRMFSDPVLARRRLGQAGFRLSVTEVYRRQCAVTTEHTLPVLEAAHIRPVTQGGQHLVSNGLLLRSDVHTLFDRGYVTVRPDYTFVVSRRLKDEWNNGRSYYALAAKRIFVPQQANCQLDSRLLEWHSEEVFLR